MADRIEIDSADRVAPPRSAGGPNWARRVVTLAIAAAAIGGFAMVVVYSYDPDDRKATGGNAPVITAQSGTKVRPDQPGGMAVPNQDKQVYGQLDTAKRPEVVERLLPPPEPVARKPEPQVASAEDRSKEMETDQARIAAQLSAIAPASGESKAPEAVPAPPQIAAVPPKPMEEKPAAKPVVSPPPMEKKAKAEPAPASAGKSSGYRIQIASLKSEAAAKTAWERLSKGNKDVLGKLEPDIVRIDLAGKGTFYRLQAGPLDGAAAAQSLCSTLKKRKIGCLVVRP